MKEKIESFVALLVFIGLSVWLLYRYTVQE